MGQNSRIGSTTEDSSTRPRSRLLWPEGLGCVAPSRGGASEAAARPSYEALTRRFVGTSAERLAHTLADLADTGAPLRAQFRYRSVYEFLLREGEIFDLKRLPQGVGAGTPGRCYAKFHGLATRYPERYAYCEGIAAADYGVPLEHAWLLDLVDGRVVDPTWHDESAGPYLGVAVALEYLTSALCRSGCVLHDWRARHPILTGEAGETWRHHWHNHLSPGGVARQSGPVVRPRRPW
jgi:hypothetical protein